MHLDVSFRNIGPRDEVRKRSEALFKKLERFLDPAAQGQVTIAIEHGLAVVETVVHSRGTTYKAQEEDTDLRTALDRVFHNVENQLRRAKEKRGNHKGQAESTDGFAPEITTEESGPPVG
jgi:ribosomal subunit interface protein